MSVPQVKGSVLLYVVKTLRKMGPNVRDEIPEALRPYLETKVMPFQWYPEADLHQMMSVVAARLPGGTDGALRGMGKSLADGHLHHLYSSMVTVGEPVRTFRRAVAALWRTQHDTGQLAVDDAGDTWVEVSLQDYGAPSEVMCTALGGYFIGTLEAAGAREVALRKAACAAAGDERCRWRLDWRA